MGVELESKSVGRACLGFTLLNLLTTIGVIGIIGGMTIPAVSNILTSYELGSAAQELAAEMDAARTLAVSRGSSYILTFNVSEQSYQVIDISDTSNPTRVARTLNGDITFLAVPSTAIRFDPRGLPGEGQSSSRTVPMMQWLWSSMLLGKPL